MKQPICVLFAGAVGSSKSPIALHLSWNLGLPIFSTDAIRTEVHEDTLSNEEDPKLYQDLVTSRMQQVLKTKHSFIFDSSVDRKYARVKKELKNNGYKTFLISLNLSKKLLTKLYLSKGYLESLKRIDNLLKGHENFIKEFGNKVNLNIDDKNFTNRLALSLSALENHLKSKK